MRSIRHSRLVASLSCGDLFQMYPFSTGAAMPGLMRSRKSGCLCLDCSGPRIGYRAAQERDWHRIEQSQLAPWEQWAGAVRNSIGPHWLDPEWLQHSGYWEAVREDDEFLNRQAAEWLMRSA